MSRSYDFGGRSRKEVTKKCFLPLQFRPGAIQRSCVVGSLCPIVPEFGITYRVCQAIAHYLFFLPRLGGESAGGHEALWERAVKSKAGEKVLGDITGDILTRHPY